jgi:hypothetical protein
MEEKKQLQNANCKMKNAVACNSQRELAGFLCASAVHKNQVHE